MISRIAVLSVVLFASGFSARDAKKDDKDRLQGKWRCQSQQVGDMKVGDPGLNELTLVVDGAKWTTQRKGRDASERTWKIDPTKDPKHLDLIDKKDGKESISRCLYELKGDTLTVWTNVAKREDRPAKMEPGTGINITVWKRVEK